MNLPSENAGILFTIISSKNAITAILAFFFSAAASAETPCVH